ncbi:hypothetical protein Glove_139g136 [Diversispora epigaea]|uniref:Uncharacterized protein n=1 Tax=Diversispora epigaea TaxID=1348612 RepID=A0A397J1S6_9GLOM|nr:hypothetical protein Glove_139g136 [Diversispora epigaea]
MAFHVIGACSTIPYQNTFNYPISYQKGYQLFMIYSLPLKKSKRSGEGYEFNEYPDPFSDSSCYISRPKNIIKHINFCTSIQAFHVIGACSTIPYQNTFNYPISYQKGYQLFMIYSLPLKKSKRSGEGYEFNEYPDPFSDVNQA